MDIYSSDSINIESLNILRPPVKRVSGSTHFDPGTSNVHFLKENHKKPKHRNCNKRRRHHIESSTSLILKRSSDKQIFDQHSIVSFTEIYRNKPAKVDLKQNHLNKDKPLIKVTVIPNSGSPEPRAKNLVNNNINKRETKVNHDKPNAENSIQTKNVYLVVKGQNKKNIYELNTTSSANLETKKINHGEIKSISNFKNFKQFIKSLNMDRKKHMNDDSEDFIPLCKCNDSDCMVKEIDTGKSKVRIYGQIGLTDDDRYVLKCAATVDDKPVITKFSRIGQKVSKGKPAFADLKGRKDFETQTGLPMHIEIKNSKESLGTQVNVSVNKKKANSVFNSDEVITDKNYHYVPEAPKKHLGLKTCLSPIVIISVYPKEENTIKNAAKNDKREKKRVPSPERQRSPNRKSVQANKNDKTGNKSYGLNRTVSPALVGSHKTEDDNIGIKFVKKGLRNRSPSPKSPSTNIKTQDSPKRYNTKEKPASSKQIACNMENKQKAKTRTKSIFRNKSVNTAQAQVKRLFKNKKELTDYGEANKPNTIATKHDVSKVSVNIDSDNEYYDISFQQGKYITDLLVRKTMKHSETQSPPYFKTDSLENFLPKAKRPHKLVQRKYNDLSTDDKIDLKENVSRLNVRDSLEISHSHELKSGRQRQPSKISIERKSVSDDDVANFAPIKHFTGDDCRIHNPIERDKEIRELLGVANRYSEKRNAKNQLVEREHPTDQNCFYYEKGKELKNVQCKYMYGASCATKKNDCNNSQNIDIQNKEPYKTEEKPVAKIIHLEQGVSYLQEHIIAQKNKPLKSNKKEERNDTTEDTSITVNPCNDLLLNRKDLLPRLNLNDDLKVFLEMGQFSKQKPIVLTKKQYAKVKKTIQKMTVKSNKPRKTTKDKDPCASLVSVGEVREKPKHLDYDKSVTKHDYITTHDCGESIITGTCNKIADALPTTICNKYNNQNKNQSKQNQMQIMEPLILCSKGIQYDKQLKENYAVHTRKTLSSMEVRFASISYKKHVFSNTNVSGIKASSSLAYKETNSIETLFRGHKKSLTPNLGTSALSLLTDKESGSVRYSHELKRKKPFLRRLMSCLVMRSERVEEPQMFPGPLYQEGNTNSSVDSYHFSTSLGAIELTSSLYDTSASFYTNHSIRPEFEKNKKGFLKCVRGFLNSRKN